MIKINLGCGSRRLPDPWVNCDHAEFAKPDMRFDFGRDPWPFAAQSADEIQAIHSIEHLKDGDGLDRVMCEAYRVLIPGGKFTIEVPHPRSDYFIGDPTHGLKITDAVLNLYSKELCEDWQARGIPNTPFALRLGVDFRMITMVNELNEHWRHLLAEDGSVKNEHYFRHCVRSLNNVLDGMRFVLERV